MVLVALAMVAIIAMAALSIDIITLYLAREEAQRSADAAALTAARVISMSGITGDPTNSSLLWATICGTSGTATQAAQAVASQNAVGSAVATTVNVTYSAGSGSNRDCSALAGPPAPFGVNPMVTVQIQQTGLPTFFSRIWGRSGNTVSATATAEAFNPSNSGNVGNGPVGTITPVQPRCVKPWVVPNQDPWNPGPDKNGNYCNQAGSCQTLVSTADGSITHSGTSLGGTGTNGVIGETFWLDIDCKSGNPSCNLHKNVTQPIANYTGSANAEPPPNLLYVPGQVGTPVAAIPSCAGGDPYEEAIAGCDAPTNYQCGVQLPNNNNFVDLTKNPGNSGTTRNGVQCLIHQTDATNITSSSGQDYLNAFKAPGSYPFQILAGSGNPLGASLTGDAITSSNSIVSLPIYDNTVNINPGKTTNVTFVGFLQVFINAVDQKGNVNVTVLNVAGCGGGSSAPNTAVNGSSPVPIRLITPP
jgi:Putative Flp pilus-assembly TadE/G-like